MNRPPPNRIFNGRTYRFHSDHMMKRTANAAADKLRRRGHYARVIGLVVWVAPGVKHDTKD